jgi:hypothetical protein
MRSGERNKAGLRSIIAKLVMLALILTLLPAPSKALWQDKSGSLPGRMSGAEKAGAIAGGAVLAGVVVYLIVRHKRGQKAAKFNPPPFQFKSDVPGWTANDKTALKKTFHAIRTGEILYDQP